MDIVFAQINNPLMEKITLEPGFRIIQDFDALDALRPEWDELQAADPNANPFVSFNWIAAWLRRFAGTYDRFVVLRLLDPGDFHGIVPLILKRTRVAGVQIGVLEFAGGAEAVYKGPIATGSCDKLAGRVLEVLLSEVAGWDALTLEGLTDDTTWLTSFVRAGESRSLRYEKHPSKPAPYLSLPGDYDSLRKGLKKSLRQNLSRKLNMAEREGAVIERMTAAALRAEHLLEAQDVERRSWKHAQGVGILTDDRHVGLHVDLIEGRSPFEVDLVFVRVNGRAIAFQYGFLYGSRYFAYNTSYDEAYQRLSPGMLVINALLQELIPRGIEVFDFLIGEDSYKRDWTSEARNIEGVTIFRRTLTGRVAFSMQHLRARLRPMRGALRRLLRKP